MVSSCPSIAYSIDYHWLNCHEFLVWETHFVDMRGWHLSTCSSDVEGTGGGISPHALQMKHTKRPKHDNIHPLGLKSLKAQKKLSDIKSSCLVF